MTNAQVWIKVEELRARYANLLPDRLPLDMVAFVELDLRLDLIPYDGLKDDFGADAVTRALRGMQGETRKQAAMRIVDAGICGRSAAYEALKKLPQNVVEDEKGKLYWRE